MLEITSAKFVRSVGRLEDVPQDRRPHIAFAGRSNVGKSALINYLVNRKGLASISKSPGKTRMLNFYLVNDRFYFVDLPGYGFAKVPGSVRRIWVQLIDDYIARCETLRMVVWLLDIRREPSREDAQMWLLLKDTCVPVVMAATKCDKVSRGRLGRNLSKIREALDVPDGLPFITTSAQRRRGRQQLLSAIEQRLRERA
jgi:GTP-binding protein